jgi:hypothetical protein
MRAGGVQKAVAPEHGVNGLSMFLRKQQAFGVLVDNEVITVAIFAAEKHDSIMSEAVIESGHPFDSAGIVEIRDNVNIASKGSEELPSSDVPIAVEPRSLAPTGKVLKGFLVIGISEGVVRDGSRHEASVRFRVGMKGLEELLSVPSVADATGIGRGIDAWTPSGFGGAAAGADVGILAAGQGRGFFNADNVVFESEIGIDIVFVLVVTGDYAGAIGEVEQTTGGNKFVGELSKEALTEVGKTFVIGFADLTKEEAFEIRDALAIIDAELSNEPV